MATADASSLPSLFVVVRNRLFSIYAQVSLRILSRPTNLKGKIVKKVKYERIEGKLFHFPTHIQVWKNSKPNYELFS